MKRLVLLGLLGLAIGVVAGGGLGAVIGLLSGLGVGGGWMFLDALSTPTVTGQVKEQEERSLTCIPQAMVADCVLERDTATGRFTDVVRCSLCTPENEVLCEKRCLRLMNDAAVA
jgi:hypothetical protein